jgi:streptogramin lyase
MTSTRPITDEELIAALRPAGPLRLPDDVLAAARAEAMRPSTPRRRWLARPGFPSALVFAALAALLLAAALAAMFVGGQYRIPQLVVSRIFVGSSVSPNWFASDDQSLWVHQPTSLVRVDLATSAVTGTVPMGYQQYGYDAAGAGYVWQTDYDRDTLMKIDPEADKVVATIPFASGSAPTGVAVTDGSVWVADEHIGAVTRLDPATDTVIATIPVGPTGSAGPQILTIGPGGVWADIQNSQSVVQVDAATNTAGVRVPHEGFVASDGTQVWIAVDGDPGGKSQVMRIDPVSGKVKTTVAVDAPGVVGLAVGLGSVWVSGNGLTQIDAATGNVVQHLDTGGDNGNLVVAGGSVWIATDRQPYVDRIALQ